MPSMALLAAWIYRATGKRTWSLVLASVAAELVMITGYWLYDALLAGSLVGALAGVPSNAVQSVLGIAASTVLAIALRGVSTVRAWFPKL